MMSKSLAEAMLKGKLDGVVYVTPVRHKRGTNLAYFGKWNFVREGIVELPDQRVAQCEHDQDTGCWRCCHYCDTVTHLCFSCHKHMTHTVHARLGTCDGCASNVISIHHELAEKHVTDVGRINNE